MSTAIYFSNGTFIVPNYTSLIVIVDGPGAGGPIDSTVGSNATGNNTFNTTVIAGPAIATLETGPYNLVGNASGGDINIWAGAMNGGEGYTSPPPGDGTGTGGDGFTGGG
jgi:hypothetical protein